MRENNIKLIKIFAIFALLILLFLIIAKTQLAYVEKQIKKESAPQTTEKPIIKNNTTEEQPQEKTAEEQPAQESQENQENQENPNTPQVPKNISCDETYNDAIKLMNEKQYSQAIGNFELCINNLDEQKKIMTLKYLAECTYKTNMYDKAKLYTSGLLNSQVLQDKEKKKYETIFADSCFQTEAYEEAIGIYEKKYNESKTLVDFKNMANTLIKLDQKEKLNSYYTNHIKLYSFDKQDLQPYKKYLDENKEN